MQIIGFDVTFDGLLQIHLFEVHVLRERSTLSLTLNLITSLNYANRIFAEVI